MPSFTLIHPTVWPQYTNVTDSQEADRQNRQTTVQEHRANSFTNGRPKSVNHILYTHCFINVRFNVVSDLKRSVILNIQLFWPPYVIARQAIIFCTVVSSSFFCLLLLFSLPNLSRRRLDVYHTSSHGVALVRI